jgi:hypothetical protein
MPRSGGIARERLFVQFLLTRILQSRRILYRIPLSLALLFIAISWLAATKVDALDYIELKRDDRQLSCVGRCLVEAQDGGLLVEQQDGVLWRITPDELVSRRTDDAPFEYFSPEELSQRLMEDLPEGFEIHKTQRFYICHNTTRAYATWCGALFERLYAAFTNYWERKGFEIEEPALPLVAVVFADKASYAAYSRDELGELANSIIGYYSLRTNRMMTYDLTGSTASQQEDALRRGSPAQINRLLNSPEAERTVATIIHEATHQIAFNCGLHQRYGDVPLWVGEGIAVYFETPDLKSRKGWRTIGSVNQVRLSQFKRYLPRRPPESLRSLIITDQRLRDPRQAEDAYAEAWALNYFLLRKHSKTYLSYLELLSKKEPLLWDEPETRLQEFTEAFGDLSKLDREFVRYMEEVR